MIEKFVSQNLSAQSRKPRQQKKIRPLIPPIIDFFINKFVRWIFTPA